MAIPKIVGLEQEYAIVVRRRDGAEALSPVQASLLLVGNVPQPTSSLWDYQGESPLSDALQVDPVPPVSPPSDAENRVINRLLANGARLYVDHAHPEFSTPECLRAAEVVAFEKAGEAILYQSCKQSNHLLQGRQQIAIFKNNSDYQGNSYGCHENYLLDARVYPHIFLGRGERELIPFLVSRQIYCGAGKVGVEEETATDPIPYQISQRADFFDTLYSVRTTSARPLLNTRDEPHADRTRFRRLHLILGDANMSAYASYLKIGTTQMVLRLFEDQALPQDLRLKNPVAAFKAISRDPTCRVTVRLQNGKSLRAVEIQEAYLEMAHHYFARHTPNPEETDLLKRWTTVIQQLKTEPMLLHRQIDWVIKRWILEWQREQKGIDWNSPRLRQLDIQYHHIDPQRGLYYLLEQEGRVEPFFSTPSPVERATYAPPEQSRAYLRSQCLVRYGSQIQRMSWGGFWCTTTSGPCYLTLPDPSRGTREECETLLTHAPNLEALLADLPTEMALLNGPERT